MVRTTTVYIYLILAVTALFVAPAVALFFGIVFALITSNPFPVHGKKVSKYLLQASVVGLGFGTNLYDSLAVGRDGMFFTIVSVLLVMLVGYILGRLFKLPPKLTHLISSGTAICGGSAIAAMSPVVKANEHETSISLAVIFTLNAVALFVFPFLGHLLNLTQAQFGLWAAIAIHDTSSVVGAGAAYGPEALAIATTVKLTRALWILPLSFVSMPFFKHEGKAKASIPWFILMFVLAMVFATYIQLPTALLHAISFVSHAGLSLTLFLIGSTISLEAIRHVGVRPISLGVLLWVLISVGSLIFIYF